MKLIMLGAPGAGKGTQAKKIAEKYSIPHISTGDIFRANIKNGTELGKKAKTFMDQGLLVPDELVVDLVVDRVNRKIVRMDMYLMDSRVQFHRQRHLIVHLLRWDRRLIMRSMLKFQMRIL